MDTVSGGFRGVGLLARMLADRAFALGAVGLCLAVATFLARLFAAQF